MLNAVLLMAIVVFMSVQQITKKAFNMKFGGGVLTFSAASCAAALVVFFITSGGKLNFSTDFLLYSLLFALSNSLSIVMSFLAIRTGPLSLTSLLTSFSLLIPTFYGILVLNEPVSASLFLGLGLLAAALVLINIEKKGEKKITFKWFCFVILAFLGNGTCTTVQKVQQIACNGQYKSESMIVALGICIVILGTLSLFTERKQVLPTLKKGVGLCVLCGLANGIVNFLAIYLTTRMAASVMYPVISAGGIVLTFFVSLFFYKEKLSKWQILGSALGLLSVIFLNL